MLRDTSSTSRGELTQWKLKGDEMKDKDFINYIKDLIDNGLVETVHYLKLGLELDSKGDKYLNFTERQKELVKQLVKNLNNNAEETMKKLRCDLKTKISTPNRRM